MIATTGNTIRLSMKLTESTHIANASRIPNTNVSSIVTNTLNNYDYSFVKAS